MTAILSHPGMVGSRFLLPPSQKMLNEDERSSSPNDDDLYGFWWSCNISARGPTAVPPWPLGTRALGQREILASRLRKAATKPTENSSQFAVWSLNRVIKIKVLLVIYINSKFFYKYLIKLDTI
jgi:hypothetical protein